MGVAAVLFAGRNGGCAGGFSDGVDVVCHVGAGKVDDALFGAEDVEGCLGS